MNFSFCLSQYNILWRPKRLGCSANASVGAYVSTFTILISSIWLSISCATIRIWG